MREKPKFKVVEKFISIDGEGPRAGLISVFIRFAGCNLRCSYCDTNYAQEFTCTHELMSAEELRAYLDSTGFKRVTFTGGEPLLQAGLPSFMEHLVEDGYDVSIETNGSVRLDDVDERVKIILDYKTSASGEEDKMLLSQWYYLSENDALKFVVGSIADMNKAKELLEQHNPAAQVFFSPVFGQIDPKDIVAFIIANKLENVRVQVQLHKIIWPVDMRGV
jgi:7-carboxy-7-deazaguanine synthase